MGQIQQWFLHRVISQLLHPFPFYPRWSQQYQHYWGFLKQLHKQLIRLRIILLNLHKFQYLFHKKHFHPPNLILWQLYQLFFIRGIHHFQQFFLRWFRVLLWIQLKRYLISLFRQLFWLSLLRNQQLIWLLLQWIRLKRQLSYF